MKGKSTNRRIGWRSPLSTRTGIAGNQGSNRRDTRRAVRPPKLDEDDQPHNKREGEDEEGWIVEDDICTDGGTVLGFFDASKPQPYDNSRRVWYVDDPHIERELVKTHDSAVGFYSLNGESLVTFTEDEEKEQICGVLEKIREQNPLPRILLVLDKHGSHRCEYTRKRAHLLGIDLIFIPSGSPHLNPIEQVWKYLKWTMAPIVVENEAEFKGGRSPRKYMASRSEDLTPLGRTSPSKPEGGGAIQRRTRQSRHPLWGGGFASAIDSIFRTKESAQIKLTGDAF